jgi:hypothetical protein
MRASIDQGSLFGYISPVTGTVQTHPPLCACGNCAMPVERFGAQPAVSLIESIPEPWQGDQNAATR